MATTHRLPSLLSPLPLRVARLHFKLLIGALIGIGVAFLPLQVDWPTRALIGWDVGVALYLVLAHTTMLRADEARMRKRAAEQDEGRIAVLVLSIVATLASLIAIVFELGGDKQSLHGETIVSAILAMVTIILSWLFVHTIFALHYAHEYYGEHRSGAGGLVFPKDDHPQYMDFVYFALVIGMTSQVSDVAITSKAIRRLATVHGVIAFFFNLTVLALTVSLISNLI